MEVIALDGIRRPTARRAGTWLLAAGMLTLSLGTPAQAAMPAQAAAPTVLWLSVQRHRTTVALGCDPPRGSHPYAAAACADLAEVGGDFDRLPGKPGIRCMELYDPVTASARGTWQGRPVRWKETFGNPCYLWMKTGPVFRLGKPGQGR